MHRHENTYGDLLWRGFSLSATLRRYTSTVVIRSLILELTRVVPPDRYAYTGPVTTIRLTTADTYSEETRASHDAAVSQLARPRWSTADPDCTSPSCPRASGTPHQCSRFDCKGLALGIMGGNTTRAWKGTPIVMLDAATVACAKNPRSTVSEKTSANRAALKM